MPRTKIEPRHAAELRATYLNTAANIDYALGKIVEAAKRHLGAAELALPAELGIIVMADHGESLYDDGFIGHGQAINDVGTRIPFIVVNLPTPIDEPFGQALGIAATLTGPRTLPRVDDATPAPLRGLTRAKKDPQLPGRHDDGLTEENGFNIPPRCTHRPLDEAAPTGKWVRTDEREGCPDGD